MTLYLHIGPSKTGTSTLQEFLKSNRAALAARGYRTPALISARNHHAVADMVLDPQAENDVRRPDRLRATERLVAWQAQFQAAFRAEAETWPQEDNVVMSSEHMAKLTRPGEVARLRDLLAPLGHEIRIVAYLRPQDQMFVSSYSERVKGGLRAPLVAGPGLAGPAYANYKAVLAPWAAAFGKDALRLGIFERSQMRDNDLISDFCRLIGLDDLAGLEVAPLQNPALDIHTLAFMQALGAHFPKQAGKRIKARRKQITTVLETLSGGPKLRLSQAEALQLRAQYAQVNGFVAREYLGRAEDDLFRTPPPEGETLAPQVSPDQALDLAADLLLRLGPGRPGAA